MTNCNKYIEQISCMLDGEASPEQEAELRAHLDQCPDCRRVYDAFMAISDEDELVPAPAGLAKSVMAGINGQKSPKPRLFYFGRFTAIAACLAILIYAGAQRGLFLPKSNDSPESANDTTVMENHSLADTTWDQGSEESYDVAEDGDADTMMFAAGTGEESSKSTEFLTSGAVVSDPTLQAIHEELDSKLRLGNTEIYEGEKATSKRFIIASADDADALLKIFDCAYLGDSAAKYKLSTPSYTIIFADGTKLLVWLFESNIYCQLAENNIYVARGTPNNFSSFVESIVSYI